MVDPKEKKKAPPKNPGAPAPEMDTEPDPMEAGAPPDPMAGMGGMSMPGPMGMPPTIGMGGSPPPMPGSGIDPYAALMGQVQTQPPAMMGGPPQMGGGMGASQMDPMTQALMGSGQQAGMQGMDPNQPGGQGMDLQTIIQAIMLLMGGGGQQQPPPEMNPMGPPSSFGGY